MISVFQQFCGLLTRQRQPEEREREREGEREEEEEEEEKEGGGRLSWWEVKWLKGRKEDRIDKMWFWKTLSATAARKVVRVEGLSGVVTKPRWEQIAQTKSNLTAVSSFFAVRNNVSHTTH